MDILNNPIIIGLSVGALTYAYLSWVQNEKNERYKKKNKQHRIEEVNLLIPLVVLIFVIVFLISNGLGSFCFFRTKK
jgi:uncharacterized membrane protein YidH (DUF202 family)